MTQKHKIQLFEDQMIRTVWDDEQVEGAGELLTNCKQLKMLLATVREEYAKP